VSLKSLINCWMILNFGEALFVQVTLQNHENGLGAESL
jgi:hypothetical protein